MAGRCLLQLTSRLKSPHSYMRELSCTNSTVSFNSWRQAFSTTTCATKTNADHTSPRQFFPRRAVIYVPASDKRKTDKVASLGVDTIVFDIEDGVALNQKAAARQSTGSAVANCRDNGYHHHLHNQELVVRINGLASGLTGLDMEAVLGISSHDCAKESRIPDSIMLPKCDSVEHLRQLDAMLALYRFNLPRPLLLHVMIESPGALINLKEILSFGITTAKHFTLSCVVFGSDDFLASIGGARTKDAHELLFARQSIVSHTKAFGLDAVDLVDINYQDLDSLREQSEEGERMGFTGKQVIHPNQVPVVQLAFSPSPQQVEWAQGLIQAFHRHQTSGEGAFVYKGEAIDRPLLLQSENIIKLQELISKQ